MVMLQYTLVIQLVFQGNPYSYIGKDVYTIFSNSNKKELNVFVRHVQTESNDGYFQDTIDEYGAMQYSYSQELITT